MILKMGITVSEQTYKEVSFKFNRRFRPNAILRSAKTGQNRVALSVDIANTQNRGDKDFNDFHNFLKQCLEGVGS